MNVVRGTALAVGLMLVGLSGCDTAASGPMPSVDGKTTVFLSVVSDVNDKPQSIDMAMKLAGFALAENRDVFMFFNVKGVHIPTSGLGDDVKFKDNEPIGQQLAELIEKGVEVHVCPICMNALGVEKGDLINGAKVTTRSELFANIGNHTTVFTY